MYSTINDEGIIPILEDLYFPPMPLPVLKHCVICKEYIYAWDFDVKLENRDDAHRDCANKGEDYQDDSESWGGGFADNN